MPALQALGMAGFSQTRTLYAAPLGDRGSWMVGVEWKGVDGAIMVRLRRVIDPALPVARHSGGPWRLSWVDQSVRVFSGMRGVCVPLRQRARRSLWGALRGSQVGVMFRRQVVIGPCIVDSCAPSVRLVVEVDGGYHSARSRADERRNRALKRLGYTVLRLSAEMVITDTGQAVEAVRRAVGQV
ncbi:MAG: DUF559 domain-containing protein [Polyangiaceae bacterium]|nr:DUF559 domain-containing protein [Polyangiaceae bacterium]